MNDQEKEINLKRLFYKALKNWRTAAVVAIVGAVVLGGTKCGMELAKISDPEVIEARETQYLGELAEYQQEGEIIRKEIENIEDTLVQQTDYNENSVLMEIDPYNEWNGSIDFYVETDWQVLPDQAIQAQNPANQIVRVYSTYITNGELYQYVIDRLGRPMEIRYLREQLSGSADASNYLIHFTVRGTTQEECQQLLTLIEEGMRGKLPEITESISEFKLLTTNSSTYSQINYGLEQSQKNNLQAINDLNTALSAKKFEQLEWEKDEVKIEKPVLDKGDAVKEGIKMAIIVGVILAVVICLFRGIGYILSKLVQDRDEFDGWGVYVAELPKSYKKKPFAWVDRLIGKWFLGNVYANEYETRLAAAAKQISEAAKLSCDTAEPKLALVSDMNEEELTALAGAMQKVKGVSGVRFTVAGNPLLSAGAIENIFASDGVILVAKQEYSKRETVYQMKVQVEELKKQLSAVVLTDADAMV